MEKQKRNSKKEIKKLDREFTVSKSNKKINLLDLYNNSQQKIFSLEKDIYYDKASINFQEKEASQNFEFRANEDPGNFEFNSNTKFNQTISDNLNYSQRKIILNKNPQLKGLDYQFKSSPPQQQGIDVAQKFSIEQKRKLYDQKINLLNTQFLQTDHVRNNSKQESMLQIQKLEAVNNSLLQTINKQMKDVLITQHKFKSLSKINSFKTNPDKNIEKFTDKNQYLQNIFIYKTRPQTGNFSIADQVDVPMEQKFSSQLSQKLDVRELNYNSLQEEKIFDNTIKEPQKNPSLTEITQFNMLIDFQMENYRNVQFNNGQTLSEFNSLNCDIMKSYSGNFMEQNENKNQESVQQVVKDSQLGQNDIGQTQEQKTDILMTSPKVLKSQKSSRPISTQIGQNQSGERPQLLTQNNFRSFKVESFDDNSRSTQFKPPTPSIENNNLLMKSNFEMPNRTLSYGFSLQIPQGPSQAIFNAKSDRFESAPVVSAKSWCIYEALSGAYIYGKTAHQKMEMASITKIMTCILTIQIMEKYQLNLEQTEVVISSSASNMIGTCAFLQQRDQVRVIDLFYGLMLPSGNDAAMALGEAIGYIIKLEDQGIDKQGIQNLVREQCQNVIDPQKIGEQKYNESLFIREMNKFAQSLGMDKTNFDSVSGLANGSNFSTSQDLCVLSCFSLQDPLFASIVKTKKYSCMILSGQEQQKSYTWYNLNQLLHQGFDGLKTGHTDSAGPCLVSSYSSQIYGDSKRQCKVIVVVLQTQSPEKRFEECEILTKWAIKRWFAWCQQQFDSNKSFPTLFINQAEKSLGVIKQPN